MAVINRPQLPPPPSGYVEDIVDGVHVWVNIITREIYGQESLTEEDQTRDTIYELLADQEYRLSLLELGVTE